MSVGYQSIWLHLPQGSLYLTLLTFEARRFFITTGNPANCRIIGLYPICANKTLYTPVIAVKTILPKKFSSIPSTNTILDAEMVKTIVLVCGTVGIGERGGREEPMSGQSSSCALGRRTWKGCQTLSTWPQVSIYATDPTPCRVGSVA